MVALMSTFLQDVRIAVRGYLAKPLFTVVVLSILGLAIGANSAIFSVVNAVLLRPLEYPRASALVNVAQRDRATGRRRSLSPPNYFDLKAQARGFAGVAAYWSPSVNLSGNGGEPEKVQAATCSYDLFSVLAVQPILGRPLTAEDDVPGARAVAILGHGLWQRRFGGDPGIVGRETMLDGAPTLIVGVMPAAFDFPVAGTELWVPLRLSRTQPPNRAIPAEKYRQYRILGVVARLNPGVALEQARLELSGIATQLEADYPDANRNTTLAVTPLQETVVAAARPALLILLAAVGCVLLIACANVGSLLLVRAAGRSREITIRMALGADRGRLIRQMLTESLVLAVAGGAVGLVISAWALDLLLRFAPEGIPRLGRVRMDGTAVAFTFGIAIAAGIMFGLAPAFQIRASRLQDALLSSGRGLMTGAHQRLRQALTVAEIALSLMLLVGAMLLIQSFARVQRVDVGFRASSVLTVPRIELPRSRASAEASAAFFEGLVARLREIPGVESAAVTLGLPLDPRARFFVDESSFSIAGETPVPLSQRPTAPIHVVGPDYFAAIGVPLRQGRAFSERDRAASPGVIIINEAMAQRFWPHQNPIGRRITHDLSIVPGQQTTREIVGVVGDVRHFGLEQPSEPQMFVPHAQMPWPSMAVVIRTPLDAARLGAAVRQAVWSVDDTIPVPPIRPMADALAGAVGQPKFRAWLLGLFAAMAMALAMTGLYGTMAYAAQQRTREIGLRIALGATPRQATALLLVNGLRLTALGTAIGLAGSVGVARALSSFLFGVGAADPATFVAVPAALAAVAWLACYLPARRARQLDPIRAINSE
jgi:putative ABC transport system permease protein